MKFYFSVSKLSCHVFSTNILLLLFNVKLNCCYIWFNDRYSNSGKKNNHGVSLREQGHQMTLMKNVLITWAVMFIVLQQQFHISETVNNGTMEGKGVKVLSFVYLMYFH